LTKERYSRQVLLPEIGPEGQERLSESHAVVIGCGALGTHQLSLLVRAGVGRITVIDRDIVELSNLQRQTMFLEKDVGRPKAKVAREHLGAVNSEVMVRGIVSDVNHTNVERFVADATAVVDATDNMETRFLINDACVKQGIPWIYGGAVGVSGMVMSIVPDGPCLRCAFPGLPQPGELPTCDTVGIINTLPSIVASMQVTEAFKIMTRGTPTRGLLVVDAWEHALDRIEISKNPECECCGKRSFSFLTSKNMKLMASLCGRNAIQIVHSDPGAVDLNLLGERLRQSGKVRLEDEVLRFTADDAELMVFSDGRTVIYGTTNLSEAKKIFSRYIGD
jgi:adenylyltransferase/sulfurtransferase